VLRGSLRSPGEARFRQVFSSEPLDRVEADLPYVEARQERRAVFAELIRASSIESSEKTHSHRHFLGLTRVHVRELNERLESALSQQTIQFRLVEEALVELTEPPTGCMFRIPCV